MTIIVIVISMPLLVIIMLVVPLPQLFSGFLVFCTCLAAFRWVSARLPCFERGLQYWLGVAIEDLGPDPSALCPGTATTRPSLRTPRAPTARALGPLGF